MRVYFLADNGVGVGPWTVAREINDVLVSGSFWFEFLTLIVSEKAAFRCIRTARVRPSGCAAAVYVFPGSGVLGQWPFNCADDFTAVRVQWISENDSYGKYANRVGPLGTGATQDETWFPLFLLACHNWAAQHGITYTTASGVEFRGCTLDKLGIANPIIGAQITWPPATQANRRWEP